MKNALSRNLEDPLLGGAEVIPTSTIQLPEQEPVVPTQDLINDAIAHRAELAESRIDLTTRDLNNKAVRNAMLPTLGLYAYYGGSGLGGSLNPNATFCPASGSSSGICINHNRIPSQFLNGPVGYGSTLTQLVDSTAPDKGVGLSLNIPLRNRTDKPTRSGPSSNLAKPKCACSSSKIRFGLKCEMRNSTWNKIVPPSTPRETPSHLPVKP